MKGRENNNQTDNGIIDAIIPRKGDSILTVARKCVLPAAAVLLIASGCMLIGKLCEQPPEPIILQYMCEVGKIDIPAVQITEEEKKPAEILPEYRELYEQNNDLAGWIRIDGTMIDDPVMQISGFKGTEDNAYIYEKNMYYLTRDFYKEDYREGCIVADYRAPITAEGRAANTLLYGHNMSSGRRFHDIAYYDPYFYGEYGIQFYKDHPVIEFDTIYEKGKYKVFAAMQTNIYEADGSPVFYYALTYTFKNKSDFYDYYGKVLDRSMFYNPDVYLQYGDEVIVLSTCDFTTFAHVKDIRFVVFARRVREGESEEVDTSKYYVNPDPLFYDYYYSVCGGAWGGRNWDPALLKGYQPESD